MCVCESVYLHRLFEESHLQLLLRKKFLQERRRKDHLASTEQKEQRNTWVSEREVDVSRPVEEEEARVKTPQIRLDMIGLESRGTSTCLWSECLQSEVWPFRAQKDPECDFKGFWNINIITAAEIKSKLLMNAAVCGVTCFSVDGDVWR